MGVWRMRMGQSGKILKTGLRTLFLTGLASLAILPQTLPAQAASNHFLCDFPESDLRVYQYMRWFPAELPIKVFVPVMPFQVPKPNMYFPLVQEAFAAWSRVAPAIKFQFVDNAKDAQIVISWREYFPEQEEMWGEATRPKPYLNERGDISHKSEVHLAVKAQPGSADGSIGAVPFAYDELLAITTHEIGHSLGLPHSKDPGDIMSIYMSRLTANRTWSITQRDINTLYALYGLPRKLSSNPCPQ